MSTPEPPDAPPAARPARPAAASGPAQALQRLGLARDIDLALHLPLRYEDETRLWPIAEAVAARPGDAVQVQGVVRECRVEGRHRRQLIVTLAEDSEAPEHLRSRLTLRFIHFHGGQTRSMAEGRRLRARGELRIGLFGPELVHPVVKVVETDEPLPQSLTPIYPTTAGLPQAYLRKAVASGLARAPLQEILPPAALPRAAADGRAPWPTLKAALQALHHPAPGSALAALEDRSHPAWERLKFEELLAQQLSQLQAREVRAAQRAPLLRMAPGGLYEGLQAALPFALTAAQRRVVQEIAADLALGLPMHRLLQGDVGAGKTVVAALAAAIAIDAGWQCALMAPTEILAEQHFRKLVGWLEPLLAPAGRSVAWLSGSRKGRARAAMVARVASGEAALVVGTHAVIQDDVHFARLGLAIVDEQHRFGVQQRLALRRKLGERGGPHAAAESAAGIEPHLLMMSATPIPRTLAMTCFADLDISTLDELPPGRTPIVTKVFTDSRRDEVVARIADEVARGRQVYWVCPLIEEADEADGSGVAADGGGGGDIGGGGVKAGRSAGRTAAPSALGRPAAAALRNVIETHALLSQALPGRRVGLVHGRLKAAEKADVMGRFSAGELDVLVATTVIEVGVDVPNASLMVVEHAERFGLSQLHQLRGRVGRGSVASVCVLLYSPPLSDAGKQRLKAMADTTDGFEIARRDLAIRGPGEFFGERQSGVPLLRFADLQIDEALVAQARTAAAWLLAHDPQAAARHVARWLGGKADLWMA